MALPSLTNTPQTRNIDKTTGKPGLPTVPLRRVSVAPTSQMSLDPGHALGPGPPKEEQCDEGGGL